MGTSRRRRTSSAKSSRQARRTARGVQPKGAPAGKRREVHPAVAGQSDATAAAPSAPRPDFPVVAIGASAGGLEAFKRFMGAMPADGGIAFALIPHLDPNHASLMVELLAKYTRMPIHEAGHGMAIERNHVYVIPPKHYLAFNDGVLALSRPPEARGRQTAIDFSLRSLAEDRKEKAIGVIFSGTGSHGTAGIKEIKFVGGMVMVQDPATAEYDQMPRSAIATGLVDYVLAPEDMPAALLRYVNHAYVQAGTETISPGQEAAETVKRVLALLRTRTRYDFRCYRKSMLMRRVQRRMGLLHLDRVDDYLKRLRDDPEEVAALDKDLLIGVTAFFREPEAFVVLTEQVIPDLIRHADGDQAIRVWCCGCATGEEAYSLSMVLIEQFAAVKRVPNFQIFASDVSEASLEVARQGSYPESIVSDVSPERLHRFFTRVGENHYQVSKQIRDPIIFAQQNMLSDPPFSKLDLISCRNLLIYLEPEVQAKAIQMFHFALNDGAYLMLGPSESIGRALELFEPVARKSRVYRRLPQGRPTRLELPLVPRRGRDAPTAKPGAGARGELRTSELMQHALTHYAPASVLINRGYEILSMQGPLVDYLEFPPGQPTQNLLTLARQGLRTKIRALCQKAIDGNAPVVDSSAHVRRNGQYIACSVTARPITEPREAQGWLLVVFQDRFDERAEPPTSAPPAPESPFVRQLEDELRTARDDLRSASEDFESANEELKASNEEVMSVNEELQSANEELESSKEELQSLNEELITVNSQLQEKVDELDRANADLTSLLESTEIATLFLDTELRVKRFTPGITDLVNVRPGDLGRPVADFATNFQDDPLLADCRRALEKLTSVERQMQSFGGQSCIRRVFPYRTGGNRIEGLIVTYTTISQLVAARKLIEEGEAYRHVVPHLPVAAIFVSDTHLYINEAAEALTGYRQGELATLDAWFAALFGARKEEVSILYEGRKKRARTDAIVVTLTRKDGAQRTIELSGAPSDGIEIIVLRDVTEKRLLQRQVLEIASREQQRVGQELHDVLLQDLTGLALLADAARHGLGAEGGGRELMAKLSGGLEQLNAKVRALCEGLIPVEIDEGDLKSALEALCESTRDAHGPSVTLEADPLEDLDPQTAHQFYRIAREAVANAVRHGHPRSIVIRLLQRDAGALALEIADDGVGFDESRRRDTGLGSRIMQYRCATLGGQLQIQQREGGGTIVSCSTSRTQVPTGRGR